MAFKDQLREFDSAIREAFPPVNRWILYISAGLFLLMFLAQPIASVIISWLACAPSQVVPGGQIWRLLTYGVLHGGFWHLAVNMIGLYFFGNRIETTYGSERYLKLALAATIFAGLLHVLGTHLLVLLGAPGVALLAPMVGASGFVFAVMMVAARMDPDSEVYIFPFPIAIKLKIYVAVIGLITLMSIPQSGGIAHLAHLGGLILGYYFYQNPWMFDRIPLPSFRRKKRRGPEIHYGGRGAWRKL